MARRASSPVSAPGADRAPVVVRSSRPGVLRLCGEHDISTVWALAAALRQAVADDVDRVVVDLRDVKFMDASAIGAIVGARTLLAGQSRALVVRAPSAPALLVLEGCGLMDLLDSGADVVAPVLVGPGPREGGPGATGGGRSM